MYCLVPEKPLRLVYGTFYLAIGETFYEFINNCFDLNHGLCSCDPKRFYRSGENKYTQHYQKEKEQYF